MDLSNVKTEDIIHDLKEIEKEFENVSLMNPMPYVRSYQLYQFKYELEMELNKRKYLCEIERNNI